MNESKCRCHIVYYSFDKSPVIKVDEKIIVDDKDLNLSAKTKMWFGLD